MEIVVLVLGAGALFVFLVVAIAWAAAWAFVRIGQEKTRFDHRMAKLHVRHNHLEFEKRRYNDAVQARHEAFQRMGMPHQGFPYPPPKRGPRDEN